MKVRLEALGAQKTSKNHPFIGKLWLQGTHQVGPQEPAMQTSPYPICGKYQVRPGADPIVSSSLLWSFQKKKQKSEPNEIVTKPLWLLQTKRIDLLAEGSPLLNAWKWHLTNGGKIWSQTSSENQIPIKFGWGCKNDINSDSDIKIKCISISLSFRVTFIPSLIEIPMTASKFLGGDSMTYQWIS